MKLDEIVAWYQKKIGTYDKQQWEKTVEQKILDGFSSITLKTAKLKTELIDVDLVRGSTFPKAKPKQSLITVIRLAIQRYCFLPIYAQWWVRQTSPNAFALLLTLYMLQMINWAIYTYHSNRYPDNGLSLNNHSITNNTDINDGNNEEKTTAEDHIVSIADLLIPMVLSLLLSLIHSQIVATNTFITGVKTKRRRFSNAASNSGLSGKLSREPRIRRRKKLVKLRNQEVSDGTTRRSIAAQTFSKPFLVSEQAQCIPTTTTTTTNTSKCDSCHNPASLLNITSNNNPTLSAPKYAAKLTLDLKTIISSTDVDLLPSTSIDCLADNDPSNLNNNNNNKKRNVNWHSPIHNYAIESQETTKSQTHSTSTTSSSDTNAPINPDVNNMSNIQSDTSSSGNNSRFCTPNKCVRIDECVQEFYDNLVIRADEELMTYNNQSGIRTSICEHQKQHKKEEEEEEEQQQQLITAVGADDDGFESLNGKSLSGEESNASWLPNTTSTSSVRLRSNAIHDNVLSTTIYRRKIPLSSESDAEKKVQRPCTTDVFKQKKKIHALEDDVTTDHTDEDGDDVETVSSPASLTGNNSNYTECTTSATEWMGVTTNSEECSYSSELENSDDFSKSPQYSDEDGYEMDIAPAIILNSHGSTDRISCTIWEDRDIKKAQMSVLEISSCIIERVESMPETYDYIYMGIVFSLLLSFVPTFCRLCEVTIDSDKPNELNYWDLPMLLWEKASFSFFTLFHFAFGQTKWERIVLIISLFQRFCLTMLLFVIFAVAERTLKQRFLYAKLFSHLTSSRRAQKSNLPHFRLNKVRNIKTWLCVRSYLKKRGPQRSVDVIVSAAFLITHFLLAFLSVEWLKDSVHLHSHLNLEALMWSSTIGIFLLRFMTLGNKIHHKYRSISVLITEQINLYLQIEQKPKKKDELMVSNSVLKLAADLLKELESPFKISGLRANPYIFTTLKVVILSALSGVLSEMLGFKLKLLKIKIK